MFERFTERARRVVVHGQEEARELNHNYIGTEHLLLGLMQEPDSVAARALQELDIGQDAAREQVVQITGRGTESPSGHIPFTPRAKKVLELSLREALLLGHNYIGTEHILLGLIREGEGVAAQVLIKLGGPLSRVGNKVIELAPAGTGESAERSGESAEPGGESAELGGEGLSAQLPPVGSGGILRAFMRRLDTIDERLAAIERHLGIEGGAGQASRVHHPAPARAEPATGRDQPAAGRDEPAPGRDEPAPGRDRPTVGE